jgi:sec-independent protein translocase protein TatA
VDLGVIAILFVAGAIAVFFGAKKLPDLARHLGRAKGEFELGTLEIKKQVDEAKKALEH